MACNEREASETREEMKLRSVAALCSLFPFGSDADAQDPVGILRLGYSDACRADRNG